MRPLRKRDLAFAAGLALVFGAGPTVGDTGSCGQAVRDIDAGAYGDARKRLDCRRCKECKLTSERCKAACDAKVPSDVSFEPSCKPLYHDAEVCLNALAATSCGDYAKYIADDVRLVPTECDFCRGVDGSVE